MLYETLKEKVADNVEMFLRRNAGFGTDVGIAVMLDSRVMRRERDISVDDLVTQARNIIARWDIRAIDRLRETLPKFFPSSLLTGQLICDMDDSGNWQVMKAS